MAHEIEPLTIPSTRQYARLVREWVTSIGLEPSAYGSHSMRRTKVAQIHRKTGTCARSNFSSATPKWTARFVISAWTWRMR
jgi:hypothetical protein